MILNTPTDEFLYYKKEKRLEVQHRSDRLMDYYLLLFAGASVYFSSFYGTWFSGILISAICLLAYYSSKLVFKDSDFYQYVLSVVLGIFMALFVYQMNGMFEMHFFAFIGSAVLITYQNWRLQIPMFLVVALHHISFIELPNSGTEIFYLSQAPFFDLQMQLIHLGLTVIIYFTCGLWAYQLNKYQDIQIWQLIEIAHFQKEAGLFEEHKKNEEAIKAYNNRLIKINEDLVASQKAVEQALINAKNADKAKSIFLATMSHEIRTPMNGVIGMSYLLAETPLDEQQRLYNDTIKASSENLLVVLNDILDYSKIEAGSMGLDSHEFDLRDAMEEVLDISNPAAAKKELEVGYLISDDVPDYIISDKTRLQQVLTNLVGNAIKFTERGEIFVSIDLVSGKNDKQKELIFSIKDTGIGISDEKKERLFKAFSQGDSSVTRRYGGTGLGLVISEKLVKLMGGEMKLESQPGKGSVFSFTISTSAGTKPFAPKVKQDLSCFVGSKVLIVDDNFTGLKILRALMTKWGMIPIMASGGKAALQLLEQEPQIKLVITDCNMPDMSGDELIRQIDINYPALPVILLKSVIDKSHHKFPGHFVSEITKPLRRNVLMKQMADAFQGKGKEVEPQHTEQHLLSTFSETHPLKILVAEDNKINQRVIIQVLSRLGFQADIAENGIEAVYMSRKNDYDLILMDVQMPEMDGLEATKKIRSAGIRQPVIIALTANAMQGDREECLSIGMDEYISKPLKVDELVKKLEYFFHNPVDVVGK